MARHAEATHFKCALDVFPEERTFGRKGPTFSGKFGISNTFPVRRSEEHTSELQSLMRISYAVFCLKKTKTDSKNKASNNTKSLRTQRFILASHILQPT